MQTKKVNLKNTETQIFQNKPFFKLGLKTNSILIAYNFFYFLRSTRIKPTSLYTPDLTFQENALKFTLSCSHILHYLTTKIK